MPIAILSALPEEQDGLVHLLQDVQQIQHAGRVFWRGSLHGQQVICALSGIGKVAAATTAVALLERNPDPDEAAVRRELSGNLCRCGTHVEIIRAVLRAAQLMREAQA